MFVFSFNLIYFFIGFVVCLFLVDMVLYWSFVISYITCLSSKLMLLNRVDSALFILYIIQLLASHQHTMSVQ